MASPDLRDILAQNVRAHRKRNGISQDDFAAKAGLHRTYIGGIERSERNITLATLDLLSNAIGVPASRLLEKGGGKMSAPENYVNAIRASGLTIYDAIDPTSSLYIPTQDLEILLDTGMRGLSTLQLPIRTRSKVVKSRVCEVLGYPVPMSFQKTQPRFPGQCFDTYVQAANNLQIWNEETDAIRRYVIMQEVASVIKRVRVVTGDVIALLDKTGSLTQKYQARLKPGVKSTELVSALDTSALRHLLAPGDVNLSRTSPVDIPATGNLLPVAKVFAALKGLVGTSFPDAGHDQERNRGAALHGLVCRALGYANYRDDGKFPDVKNQLLEVKLQTAPTIDLGLVCPNSITPLNISSVNGLLVRHCDVRYALFGAKTDGATVTLTSFYLSTGADFFSRFPQFQGKIVNKKLQIPLPSDFFTNPKGSLNI